MVTGSETIMAENYGSTAPRRARCQPTLFYNLSGAPMPVFAAALIAATICG